MVIEKKVRIKDKEGNVIKIFNSVNECAKYIGLSYQNVYGKIRYHTSFNGMYLEFDEEPSVERRRASNGYPTKQSIRENLKVEELDAEASYWASEGEDVELMKYEKIKGCICTTPCMKYEFGDRPTIGSVRCIQCKYFRGRCPDAQIILCSQRSVFALKHSCGRKKNDVKTKKK